MNPEQQTDSDIPHRPTEGQDERRAHTFQDDLNQAMDVTEAPVVQEMLQTARDREAFATEEVKEQEQKKSYSLGSIIFLLLTLGIIGYGAYHYAHLTVKLQPTQSVGVFPTTPTIVASTTTLPAVLTNYAVTQSPQGAGMNLSIGKPTLVNLVSDGTTNTLLSNAQLYSFIGATVPEPLQSIISVARLGLVNTGKEVDSFIIMSVPNPDTASREFSIAESSLLQLFGPALGIHSENFQNIIGQSFQSQYFYNLPVRIMTGSNGSLFLYGYANNNTVVIASDPFVLKAVYDALINQH